MRSPPLIDFIPPLFEKETKRVLVFLQLFRNFETTFFKRKTFFKNSTKVEISIIFHPPLPLNRSSWDGLFSVSFRCEVVWRSRNKAGYFFNKLFKNCFFFKKWKYCLEDSLLMNTESYKLMKTHLQIAHSRDISKCHFWRAISMKTCCCNIFCWIALCNRCCENITF